MNDKLIDRIRKILAKASSTNNQHEADALLEKANELLMKYNLSMSEIGDVDNQGITEIKGAVDFGTIKEEGTWEKILLQVICEFNLCHSIIHQSKGKKSGVMSIIGQSHNILAVKYMFEVTRETFRRLSKQTFNQLRKDVLEEWSHIGASELDLQKSGHLPYRMPFIRSYLKGCSAGLYRRLQQKERQTKHAYSQTDVDDQYGLMIVRNNTAIDKFIESTYGPDLKQARKQKHVGDSQAFSQGYNAGKSHNLTQGIETNSHQTILIS